MSRDRLADFQTVGRDGQSYPSRQQPQQPQYGQRQQYGQQQPQYGQRDDGYSRGDYGRAAPSASGSSYGAGASGRPYNPPAGTNVESYEMPSRTGPPRGASRPAPSAGGGGDFYSEVEEIQASIDAINRNVSAIERLHNRALVGVSQDETNRINRDLDNVQNETSDLIADARRRLQRISNETKRLGGNDARTRQAQQSVLAQKLMDAAQTYQNIQVAYKQKYRQRMEREIRVANPSATREEVERALDSNNGSVFAQQLLSSRIGEQRRVLQEVQGRHEELRKMEQSIEELAQLFQDMQVLLEAQQTTIDTIDTHVENTVQYVEQGGKELTQAIQIREASRKKLWYITAAVIIVLIIIAAILYFYRCSLLKIDCPK
ncbi:hypothetical protein HK105_203735 [Polyrhizophydium stewartii]|uniref:t-SNARE coiled-coil homology domain-containing protein n=1 Tax=Polyrhizophydium stewartii TaxID=2732419 RepID=A0ABR4NAS3_9FUNG